MHVPGPLWRAAPTRLLRSGTWAMLVLLAFALLAAAAASTAMFREAGRNAAMRSALDAVPASAPAADAPVVRALGAENDAQDAAERQQRTVARLARIPGLTRPEISGVSVGAEFAGREDAYDFTATAGGRTERMRLVSAPRPAEVLRVRDGGGPADGVWLPAPTARALRIGPGDEVTLSLHRRSRPGGTTTVRVAGVYAVASDGRRPDDIAGGRYWQVRRGTFPGDPQYPTITAHLLVGSTDVVRRLAEATQDEVLFFIDARLTPGNDTLAGVGATAAGVEQLRLDLRDPSAAESSSPLRETLASGISIVHGRAQAVADATATRADALGQGALLLAFGAVGAVVLLGAHRRRTEVRLTASLGVPPPAVGALSALEHLPAALAGGLLGLGGAYGVVRWVGPPGEIGSGAVTEGGRDAAVALLGALVLVVVLTTVDAVRLVRPASGRLRRRVPWEALLAVAAVTAAAGLLSGPDDTARAGGLALLVPLLVTAAVGAVGARVVTLLLRLALARTRSARRRGWPGWLALRRLASPAGDRAAVTGVLATGLALLLFALAGATATEVVNADRVAVRAGAAATAELQDSSQIDPAPPRRAKGEETMAQTLRRLHNPPTAPGQSVVWRTRVGIGASEFGNVDLLVVDPATFRSAALWGRGPQLAAARRLLDRLGDRDRAATAALAKGATATDVPMLAINAPTLTPGNRFELITTTDPVNVRVIGASDVFPGLGDRPLLVAPATSLLVQQPAIDPRYADTGTGFYASFLTPSLWSAKGPADLVRKLDRFHVTPVKTASASDEAQQPVIVAATRGLGYVRALGVCTALIAALAFALHADRSTSRGRAADLLLAAVGLGRRGVRAARLGELGLMAAVAAALAVGATALLRPMAGRLLDPEPGSLLPVTLRLDGGSLLWTLLAVAGSFAAAATVAVARQRSGTNEEVLRGTE